jgi:hypothetical protein
MRYREDNDADVDRACAVVAEWRETNPDSPRFRAEYAVVLRGVLFAVDRDRSRQIAGGRP